MKKLMQEPFSVIPCTSCWGKALFSAEGGVDALLPLEHHCRDVAVTFRVLLSLPTIRSRLANSTDSPLTERQCDRLAVLAFLHDVGKANSGFQRKIFDSRNPRIGHIREIGPLLEEFSDRTAEALQLDVLLGWFDPPEALEGLLVASWSHHGKPVVYDPCDRGGDPVRWWLPDNGNDPFECVARILDTARRTFPDAFSSVSEPLPACPYLQHRFAGLLMLADWIGSHERFFPIRRRRSFDPVAAAQKAVESIGLNPANYQAYLSRHSIGFFDRFGWTPYPLQSTLHALPTAGVDTRLIIAESETGSGKTEAALTRFLNLFASKQVDSLYFALPTRVAARELYLRICSYIDRIFPDQENRPHVYLAVPGYSRVDNVPLEQILVPIEDEGISITGDRTPAWVWAAERPKRFLAAPVAVGTIDQALLSALQVPHAHLRSVCLDRSLLVVDEVHSSDTYMRVLLQNLLSHHLRIGGHALLLSATLGARMRTDLTSSRVLSLSEAIESPYPACTYRNGYTAAVSVPGRMSEGKSVHVELAPYMSDLLQVVSNVNTALLSGARVFIILNTVKRAVMMQQALESNGEIPPEALFSCAGVICPHHGRFSPSDREILDQAVSNRFGKGSPSGPVCIVGTQTLEQSLDIDSDLLITDLCPMDVLLQRIGRLHRHHRERPGGYEQARCIVLTPENGDFSSLLTEKGEATGNAKSSGLGSVYEDMRILQLTQNILADRPKLEIPKDNRLLVERTSHPEALASLSGQRWERHAQAIEGISLAHQVQAHFSLLTPYYQENFGTFTFQGPETNVRTRLGLDTLCIPLDQTVRGPFGASVSEVTIPGHLSPPRIDEERATVLEKSAEHIRIRFSGEHYSYTRYGLEKADESTS